MSITNFTDYILLALSIFCSCSSDKASFEESSPQLFGVYRADAGDAALGNDCIVFTDADIVWFNPKTREIKFKESDKIEALPMDVSISVKTATDTLFVITGNISSVVSKAYDDLVLFYNITNGKYYLYDNYPDYWDREKTKQNADKRSDGWNAFLKILRSQGRIR